VSNPALPTLAERLGFMMRALFEAIAGHRLGGVLGGRIPGPLIQLLTTRINAIRIRFAALADRIVAGTYTPRRYAPRRPPSTRKPPTEAPFRQKFGWLDALLPPEVARQHRSNLFYLLQDPEIAALIAAAPDPMARLFRPLCWMLKLKPPEVLANPRRPAGTPPPPPAQYTPPPPPTPPIPGPANTLGLHPIQLLPMRPPPNPA
jgi:hypothetical protein